MSPAQLGLRPMMSPAAVRMMFGLRPCLCASRLSPEMAARCLTEAALTAASLGAAEVEEEPLRAPVGLPDHSDVCGTRRPTRCSACSSEDARGRLA
eukprot:7816366-Heterocapsa_arctica.AAC.1